MHFPPGDLDLDRLTTSNVDPLWHCPIGPRGSEGVQPHAQPRFEAWPHGVPLISDAKCFTSSGPEETAPGVEPSTVALRGVELLLQAVETYWYQQAKAQVAEHIEVEVDGPERMTMFIYFPSRTGWFPLPCECVLEPVSVGLRPCQFSVCHTLPQWDSFGRERCVCVCVCVCVGKDPFVLCVRPFQVKQVHSDS